MTVLSLQSHMSLAVPSLPPTPICPLRILGPAVL